MKLLTAQVQDFRCVTDSGEFKLAEVACLVGKNESGKTAILAALEKINAADPSRAKFIPLDYPRRKWRPADPIPADPSPITTKWELTKEELAKLEERFGTGAVRSKLVVVSKNYANELSVLVDIDEAAVVRHILITSSSTIPPKEDGSPRECNDLAALRELLKEPTAAESLKAVGAALTAAVPENAATITKTVQDFIPKMLYFGQYDSLAGAVSLNHFLTKKASNQLSQGERYFEALLNLAGTTPEQVNGFATFEDLNASLKAVSNQISEEIFTFWSQNKYLDVELRLDHSRPGDKAPLNEGFVFRTRIKNNRHKVDTSFDERSTGFVWFFSFLIWFSQLRKQYGKRLLILLDEPGLHLHARAQGDLLRYINTRLKPNYQVIYTTHSPFMVDADNLLSARTVEDVELKDGTLLGTKVSGDVLSRDADTISPLQRALDYEMTQTLFVGRNTLLVEGPADLAYLKWFSARLQVAGKPGLDYRWSICIVGGVDRMPPFVSLFKGNNLNVVGVVDVAVGTKAKIQNVKKALGENKVLTADTYASQAEADIEDVLGRDFYVALVNAAYNLRTEHALKIADLGAEPRVVKDVENAMKLLGTSYPEFDHYTPAEWLFESPDRAKSLTGYATALANMEKLITDINKLI